MPLKRLKTIAWKKQPKINELNLDKPSIILTDLRAVWSRISGEGSGFGPRVADRRAPAGVLEDKEYVEGLSKLFFF